MFEGIFKSTAKFFVLCTVSILLSCQGNLSKSLSGNKDSDSSDYNSGTDTLSIKPDGLLVDPSEVRLLIGERVQLNSYFTNLDGAKTTATNGTTWSVADDKIAQIDPTGIITGKAAGKIEISATASELKATANIEVLGCKIVGKSPKQNSALKISGDAWPPQGKDADPPTFEDYKVKERGKFLIDDFQIFASEEQEVEFTWAFELSAVVVQKMHLKIINCDNNAPATYEVLPITSPTGTHKLSAKKGDRVSLFVYAEEGITSRTYDLLFEKSAAFEVTEVP